MVYIVAAVLCGVYCGCCIMWYILGLMYYVCGCCIMCVAAVLCGMAAVLCVMVLCGISVDGSLRIFSLMEAFVCRIPISLS